MEFVAAEACPPWPAGAWFGDQAQNACPDHPAATRGFFGGVRCYAVTKAEKRPAANIGSGAFPMLRDP